MAPATDPVSQGSEDPLGGIFGQGLGGSSVGNQDGSLPANHGGHSRPSLGGSPLGNLGGNSLDNAGGDPVGVGDMGGNSMGKAGGKSGGPTTTSKGTDPLSQDQPLLPGGSITRPLSGTLGSPVTSSDGPHSATQSAQPARHTIAPSPNNSTDDKMHTQSVSKNQATSTIGPSATSSASASPSPSSGASSEASHLVGPIMGLIFVVGVMSFAGMLFLQYHRRRREAARKLQEDQNAITFINQLSQYDKPESTEKL